eukprot:2734875-Pyramimonas_sp.AAC.1
MVVTCSMPGPTVCLRPSWRATVSNSLANPTPLAEPATSERVAKIGSLMMFRSCRNLGPMNAEISTATTAAGKPTLTANRHNMTLGTVSRNFFMSKRSGVAEAPSSAQTSSSTGRNRPARSAELPLSA